MYVSWLIQQTANAKVIDQSKTKPRVVTVALLTHMVSEQGTNIFVTD